MNTPESRKKTCGNVLPTGLCVGGASVGLALESNAKGMKQGERLEMLLVRTEAPEAEESS